jgi:3,5-epimerase/4-reductase
MQTWLVYGAHGWIAKQFAQVVRRDESSSVHLVEATARGDDYAAVLVEVRRVKPARVISMLGRTSAPALEIKSLVDTARSTIDFLEQPGNLRMNVRDNLMAPLVMERVCRETNTHFTYLGTGCIFTHGQAPTTPSPTNIKAAATCDGQAAAAACDNSTDISKAGDVAHHYEGDAPTFFGSSYSTVKGMADVWMHHSPHTLNVRIRMPITSGKTDGKNFLAKLIAYSKTQIHSTLNSMTVLDDLLPVLVRYIKSGRVGTMHLANPGPMTHNQILELYKHIVEPTLTWRNADAKEMETMLLAKRSSCVLDTAKLSSEFPHVPTLADSLRRIFGQWSHLATTSAASITAAGAPPSPPPVAAAAAAPSIVGLDDVD